MCLSFVAFLFPIHHASLENLAAMEETVVRDKAVESACVVIGLMQGGQQEVRGLIWYVTYDETGTRDSTS